MTKLETKAFGRLIIAKAAANRGYISFASAEALVARGHEGLKTVLRHLRSMQYCKIVPSNDPCEDGMRMIVLTPEGLEEAGCISLEEAEKNWEWV
jgi:hypothetical protein